MEEELVVAVDTPVSPMDMNTQDFGKKREYFSDSKSKLKCRAALSFMEVKSIVAASFGDNERRCYKVHWKDSWIYEDHLFGCEEIITEFWKRRENVKEHTRNLSVDGNDGLNNIFATSDKDEDEQTSSELTVIVLREDHSESSNGIAEKGNEGEINVLPDMHNHHGSNSNAMKIAWEEDDTKAIHKRNVFEAVDDGKENQVAWEDEDIGLKVNLGHKRRDILTCHICGDSFDMVSAIRRHYNTNHPGNKPFACDSCGKRFDRKENLSRHIRIHTGDRRYICHHCNKGYTDPSGLKKHILSKHSSSIFPCQFCKATFKSKESMNRHLIKHSQNYRTQTDNTSCIGMKRTLTDNSECIEKKVFYSSDAVLRSKISNLNEADENVVVNNENFVNSQTIEPIEVQYIQVSQEDNITMRTEEEKVKTCMETDQYSNEHSEFVLPLTTEHLLKLASEGKTLPVIPDNITNINTEHLKLMSVSTVEGGTLPLSMDQSKSSTSEEELKYTQVTGDSFLSSVSNSTGEQIIAVTTVSPHTFPPTCIDKLPSPEKEDPLLSPNEVNENIK